MTKNITNVIKHTLTALAAIGALTGFCQTENTNKYEEVTKITQKRVADREEKELFETPLFLSRREVQCIEEFAHSSSQLVLVRNGKPQVSTVKPVTYMPECDRKAFLKASAGIKAMGKSWGRFREGLAKALKPEDYNHKFFHVFREDVNGVFTTWLFDNREKTRTEISFDHTGRIFTEAEVGKAKGLYCMYPGTETFLCCKTEKGEYLTTDVQELNNPKAIFTFKDSQKKDYICANSVVYTDNAGTLSVYTGTIQDIQNIENQSARSKMQKMAYSK